MRSHGGSGAVEADVEVALRGLSAVGFRLEKAEPSEANAPALSQIGAALEDVFDALSGRTEAATALERAESHAIRAAALLARTERGLAVELLTATRALAGSAPAIEEERAEERDLSVTGDSPPAHALSRPAVVPMFRARPLAAPRERQGKGRDAGVPRELQGENVRTASDLARAEAMFEALAAEALSSASGQGRSAEGAKASVSEQPPQEDVPNEEVPPFVVPRACPAPLSRDDVIEERARFLFEELRLATIHRTPQAGEAFTAVVEIERRMMAALDAFVALGPHALACVEKLACDAPAPDPTRVFAASFLASSVRGRDLFSIAERALRANDPTSRASIDAAIDGFSLGASSDIDPPLVVLARDRSPFMRRLALTALSRRGRTPKRLAEALIADADLEVAWLAITELAGARDPAATHAIDEALARTSSLGEAARSHVLPAVWRALAFARDPRLSEWIQSALDSHPQAPLWWSLVRGHEGARELVAKRKASPTASLALALGFSGNASIAPSLIEDLASDDDEIGDAAARALARITGVFPLEEALVDPASLEESTLIDPIDEPPEPATPEASEASPDHVQRLSRDPSRWAEAIASLHDKREESVVRRHGRAWSKDSALAELTSATLPYPSSPLEREIVYLEIVVRSGVTRPFSTKDLVFTQLARAKNLFG